MSIGVSGVSVQDALIDRGAAQVGPYSFDFEFIDEFVKREEVARAEKRGLSRRNRITQSGGQATPAALWVVSILLKVL